MKLLMLMSLLIALVSCRSGIQTDTKKDDFVRMNEVWQLRLNKNGVVKYFGPHFKEIEEGILYNYDHTDFTKMAFFFDKNEKLIDQFAIVGLKELSIFKNGVPCKWTEKKTQLKDAHVVKIVESGECPEQDVRYFFRKEMGLYEIRWY